MIKGNNRHSSKIIFAKNDVFVPRLQVNFAFTCYFPSAVINIFDMVLIFIPSVILVKNDFLMDILVDVVNPGSNDVLIRNFFLYFLILRFLAFLGVEACAICLEEIGLPS